MQDQEAYETRETHKGLEWFRPPEHKTLRPLSDVLPELVNLVVCVCLSLRACETSVFVELVF
jgi:hypothetical protein